MGGEKIKRVIYEAQNPSKNFWRRTRKIEESHQIIKHYFPELNDLEPKAVDENIPTPRCIIKINTEDGGKFTIFPEKKIRDFIQRFP